MEIIIIFCSNCIIFIVIKNDIPISNMLITIWYNKQFRFFFI